MKVTARVGDREFAIDIEKSGNRSTVHIDDRRLETEISEPEPGIYLLKHKGKVFEAFVAGPSPSGEAKVTFKGREFEVRIADPRRLSTQRSGDIGSDGIAEIRTAMPGKVVRLLVTEGAVVEKSDGLVVVEAMKMQNEIRSPKSGTVKKINVQDGATVGAGELLVTIE